MKMTSFNVEIDNFSPVFTLYRINASIPSLAPPTCSKIYCQETLFKFSTNFHIFSAQYIFLLLPLTQSPVPSQHSVTTVNQQTVIKFAELNFDNWQPEWFTFCPNIWASFKHVAGLSRELHLVLIAPCWTWLQTESLSQSQTQETKGDSSTGRDKLEAFRFLYLSFQTKMNWNNKTHSVFYQWVRCQLTCA